MANADVLALVDYLPRRSARLANADGVDEDARPDVLAQVPMRLVIQLLVDKYVDGLPLHRQRERFQRLGIDLSVSTLCDQVKWCTDLLRPLWRAALAEVIASEVMHLDGAGLPVLDGKVRGKTRLGGLRSGSVACRDRLGSGPCRAPRPGALAGFLARRRVAEPDHAHAGEIERDEHVDESRAAAAPPKPS